jgi:hypothetical protein
VPHVLAIVAVVLSAGGLGLAAIGVATWGSRPYGLFVAGAAGLVAGFFSLAARQRILRDRGQAAAPERTIRAASSQGDAANPYAPPQASLVEPATPPEHDAIFFNPPVWRLVWMSAISLGLFQTYWFYRQWCFVKARDNLAIRPAWRAVFSVLYAHSLFYRIHDEPGRATAAPRFGPGPLATLWVIAAVANGLVVRAAIPGLGLLQFALFGGQVACLFVAQRAIRAINRQASPPRPCSRWSLGHSVCIALGLLLLSGQLIMALAGLH